MNDADIQEGPTERRAGNSATPPRTGQPIMRRLQVFTTRLLAIAYPTLTLLGLLYAHWYYDHFDIAFLGHATPLDLLLVAFANADKIAIILGLAIYVSLVAVMALLFVLLCAWSVALVASMLVALLKFGEVLHAALAVVARYVLAALAAIVSPPMALGRLAAIAVTKGRQDAATWWRADSENGGIANVHLRRLMYLWRSASQSAQESRRRLASKSSKFKQAAAALFGKAMGLLGGGLKGIWSHKATIMLASFGLASVFVAVRTGQLDAECVSGGYCTFGPGVLKYNVLDYVNPPKILPKDGQPMGEAVIVPTSNLAALEYLPKHEDTPARRHVRVTIRQDAGGMSFPMCLTELGSTESAHFSFNFLGDRWRFESDKRCQAASMQGCDMDLAARVGPFAVGQRDVGEKERDAERWCSVAKPSGVPVFPVEPSLGGDLRAWLEAERMSRSREVRRLIFVGRTDRVPIGNERFPSNFVLAQSRADWVREALLEGMGKAPHVLSLPGGPAADDIDACDRVVEIHMCWGPGGRGTGA